MKIRNLFCRAVTVVMVIVVLLPQGAAVLKSARADGVGTLDGVRFLGDPNAGWEEVGGGSATGGGISGNGSYSGTPSMAIAPDGTPYVAWFDDSNGDHETYVRYWNGSRWAEAGAGAANSGGISDNSGNSGVVSMALAPGGVPYVAWEDDSGKLSFFEDDI